MTTKYFIDCDFEHDRNGPYSFASIKKGKIIREESVKYVIDHYGTEYHLKKNLCANTYQEAEDILTDVNSNWGDEKFDSRKEKSGSFKTPVARW